MNNQPTYDLIVWGASGFTGRLVAEYLYQTYGAQENGLRWAMGGRNADKLKSVANELGIKNVPIITGDASDRASLRAIAEQTRVICTTVGPYHHYGSAMVEACVAAGTDYVDLSGEPAWMRKMIDLHGDQARASGARIVHSCGFDSIPFDFGVLYLQTEAQKRFGAPCVEVKGRVKAVKGKASGGTIASMIATIEAGADDPNVRQVMTNPYGLAPDETVKRPRQPNGNKSYFDKDANSWVAPFVMAVINTKNVHRSNMLMNYAYGKEFLYSEMMITRSRLVSTMVAASLGLFAGAITIGPVRSVMKRFMLPSPGEGPNAQEREAGFYVVHFIGKSADGTRLTAKVKGERDPGYGSTSRMIGEAAVCLALDVAKDAAPGGFWTPAAVMGPPLMDRLIAKAGLSFSMLD